MGQMKHIQTPPHHSTASPPAAASKDDAAAHVIRGLSLLMAHAQSNGLGTAARILSTAKEDMVHWAVDMNFHESTKDQYINHHMFCPNAYAAAQLLTQLNSLEDTPLRSALLREFSALMLQPNPAEQIKKS